MTKQSRRAYSIAAVSGAGLLLGALAGPAQAKGGVEVNEVFRAPSAHGHAFTYDEKLVPVGTHVTVVERVKNGQTVVELRVHGVTPHHHYGAHVHAKACGRGPNDSGPHYQNVPDPHQPSTDPRYANARNEVWLDFHADEHGDGSASATQKWTFRPGEARAVVLHEHGTSTDPGHSGQAGNRVACVTVPFD